MLDGKVSSKGLSILSPCLLAYLFLQESFHGACWLMGLSESLVCNFKDSHKENEWSGPLHSTQFLKD